MGSITYDFLANSILFNDDEIANYYSSLNVIADIVGKIQDQLMLQIYFQQQLN